MYGSYSILSGLKSGNRTSAYFRVELITRSEQLTLIPSLCYGVFTRRFILRYIYFRALFPAEKDASFRLWVHSKCKIWKRKTKPNVIKIWKTPFSEFLLTGLWDLKDIRDSRQNHSKNKLIGENAVTWVHNGCPLQIMGYCFRHIWNNFNCELSK